jgi:hypothetical protein
MGALRRAWKAGDQPLSGGPSPVRVQHVEAAMSSMSRMGPAGASVLAGLNPVRLPYAGRATALAEIGAAAGNAAVAQLVAQVRTDFPQNPPQGVREIRRIGGGGQLGHCRTFMPASPPLFRLGSPEATTGGFAVRPARTQAPEFEFHVRYPTAGRHLLYESRTAEGAEANIWLDVSQDWSGRILQGEEEHVADQSIARSDTWERVADATNRLADGPPIIGASPDEARRAAWSRFVEALPPLLRPAGRDASEDAQLAKWGPEVPTSVFRQLVGESKRARDDSQWHTPSADLDHMEGPAEVRKVEAGNSKIPGTLPDQLMEAAWNRLAAAASGGGGGRGGSARRRRR